jgi:phage gpG-like protein
MKKSRKKQIIEAMVVHDYDFAVKCLTALYDEQTLDEQQAETTLHENGRGFNASDAPVMSGYAEWIREGKSLRQEEREELHKRLTKYANQLTALISDNEIEDWA